MKGGNFMCVTSMPAVYKGSSSCWIFVQTAVVIVSCYYGIIILRDINSNQNHVGSVNTGEYMIFQSVVGSHYY